MMIHDGNKGGGLEHLWKGKRLYCFKCGHQWISRSETRPNVCPKCHIRRYDIPPDKYTCKLCGAEWKPGCVDDTCPKCGHATTEGTSAREHSCNQCGHMDVIGRAYTLSLMGYGFSVRHSTHLPVIGYWDGIPLSKDLMSFHPNSDPDLHSIRDT